MRTRDMTMLPDEQAHLLERATERGYLLRSELASLDGEQADELREMLEDDGVAIVVDDVPDEEPEEDGATEGFSRDPVRAYLDRAGTHELLTREEEADLAKRYQAGLAAESILLGGTDPSPSTRARLSRITRDGEHARDRLVTANLRLVVPTAKRYAGDDMPLIEAIQEGNLGLLRAVERFDHTKGYKFSTYAVWWIRQAAQRGLASGGRTIRVPSSVWEDAGKVRRATARLRTDLERDPTDDEISEATGLRVQRIRDVRDALRPLTSLDKPVGEDGELSLGGLLADTDAIDPAADSAASDARERLLGTLDALPDRQRTIIELRYGLRDGETHTLREIGEVVDLNRERVRQLEMEALERLAVHASDHGLEGMAVDLAA